MPVSFAPANHPANPVSKYLTKVQLPRTLLEFACPNQYAKCDEILQSSFGKQHHDNAPIIPRSNGFVETVIQAYNGHHALIIRPDDVWLAILTQFNFFVNGKAEMLRSHFVHREGQKHLVVYAVGTRYTVDFGHLARTMTGLIHENIADPTLHEWILPDFSTTTLTDTTVAAVVMMATMKSYFTYEFHLLCGIPRVTLEGEKSDWEKILARLEKLNEYGVETTAWYHLLVPVVNKFVKAFDDPNGQENIAFWQKVAHREGLGSGPPFLSGWITAFCAFDEKGRWLGNTLHLVCRNPPDLQTERCQLIVRLHRILNLQQIFLYLPPKPSGQLFPQDRYLPRRRIYSLMEPHTTSSILPRYPMAMPRSMSNSMTTGHCLTLSSLQAWLVRVYPLVAIEICPLPENTIRSGRSPDGGFSRRRERIRW
jgi:hypothetical protein